jgi:hypothetical protein
MPGYPELENLHPSTPQNQPAQQAEHPSDLALDLSAEFS